MRSLDPSEVKRAPEKTVERYVPPTSGLDSVALARVMADAIRQIEFPVPQVTVHAPKIEPKITMPSNDTQVNKWVFSVQRDKDGLIKTITAEAK